MGIDWEGLLGAEGDELQDAYDEAVDAWDDWEEEQEIREDFRAVRRLVRFWSEDVEERTAVKEALNALFHTEFKWMATWPGGMEDRPPDVESYLWEDDGTKTKLEDGTVRVEGAKNRVVLMNTAGAIVLLSKELSKKVFFDSNLDAVCDCIADSRAMKYPFQNKDVSDLKHEYDADGMPVRVYGKYYHVERNWPYARDEEYSEYNYTVWRRSDYREEDLIWVFRREQRGGKLVLKPLEIWTADYMSRGKLIWQARL